MKHSIKAAVLATGLVAAGPFIAIAAPAQQAANGPTCFNVTYHPEFLKAYPRAPAACMGVVTRKSGDRVIRFQARVASVKDGRVMLEFLDALGNPIQPVQQIELVPTAGSSVLVGGKPVSIDKLGKGDSVDFWVPESRIAVITDPSASAESRIVLPGN